jgi:ECF transporter S component (folate family)
MSLFTALTIVGEDLLRFPIFEGTLEIRFSFVFRSATGFMFGPVAGCMVGIISDLLAYIIRPGGAFHIGFTLNAAIAGIIYGIFLYKKDSHSRYFIIFILISKVIVNFVINITLTPIWLGIFGKGGNFITLARLYKNIVLLPVEIVVMILVFKSLTYILNKTHFTRGQGL